MVNSRRGQAALEYLMTYGWALLIVLIILASLFLFAGFNIQLFLPDACDLGSGLECKDYTVSAGSSSNIQVIIFNGVGTDLKNFNISLEDCHGWVNSQQNGLLFGDGEEKIFVFSCPGLLKDQSFSSVLFLNYSTGDSYFHEKRGMLRARVS